MKTNDERIRRLEIANRALLAFIVLLILGVMGKMWLNSTLTDVRSLSVTWQLDGEIRFSSSSDGPFVVTHIVKYGNNSAETIVACLAQPLAMVDSAGATLSRSETVKLRWVNIYGQAVAPPQAGTKIKALYLRTEVATQRE